MCFIRPFQGQILGRTISTSLLRFSLWEVSYNLCYNYVCQKLVTIRLKNMLIGYVRVSTGEQNPDLQIEALTKAGCERIYQDLGISGSVNDRPELGKALDQCRKGDTLMVWRLDRLGRSLSHLIRTVADLGDRGVEFQSLTESIETSTAAGRLAFHLFCSFAEFERNLGRERTMAGLESARARGKMGGRPVELTQSQIETGKAMAAAGTMPITQICKAIGCSRSTFYRVIATKAG